MNNVKTRAPKMPAPWFVHTFWRVHRGLYRLSGGRFLWTPASKRGWGALHLTTIGRKSGEERSVIVGYLEDGSNLVTLAMNGWARGIQPGGSTSKRTQTLSFGWRTRTRVRSAHALPSGKSETGCGIAG
jgi:hypothetical protein